LGDARTLYNKWWKRQLLRLAKGVIPLERLWSEELAVIEGAKQGVDELADLAAAIEHDIPHGGSIETLRRLDRIVQAMFARGDGILIFPEGGLGKVEVSCALSSVVLSSMPYVLEFRLYQSELSGRKIYTSKRN
jgi:1-acyl-sn-glycerol-3-phosphate acyltransferase